MYEISDKDWQHLDSECNRLVLEWERDNLQISASEESAFEYGFELGYRIAKGEVIGDARTRH